MKRLSRLLVLTGAVAALLFSHAGLAASAEKIDREANKALQAFGEEVDGAEVFLKQAAGYLIFPKVYKAGIGVGAETDEGALRVGGRTAAYYRTTARSFGLQLGAQAKSIVIAFMTAESLKKFQNASGWKVGVDGSVAVIEWGVGKDINTIDVKDPIVGFVFNNKGLMYNLTLEGSKMTKIVR